MSLWRLLSRPRRETPQDDPFPSAARTEHRPAAEGPARLDALSRALSEMESAAHEVYALHGLPTRPGHYERPPRARRWRFIAEELTPEERFQRALAQPPQAGWRFGRLEDLGARSNKADLAAASDLLRLARRLREARDGPLLAEDLLTAMELGAAWRANREIILAARVRGDGARPERSPRSRKPRSGADAAASSG